MRILITGASSGIGKQLALDYLSQQHQVVGVARGDLSELEQQGLQALRCDVTDLQQVREVLGAQDAFDIVVLCAGNCEYTDPERFDAELCQRVWQVNLQGVANCLDALWPKLYAPCKLAIVGSLARLLPFTRASAYGSSKAALHYLASSLRVDLAPRGVTVHYVQPGFVKTPLTDKNNFAMPQLISPDKASWAIRNGLEQGRWTISFPTRFSAILRLLSMLPQSWQQKICIHLANSEAQ